MFPFLKKYSWSLIFIFAISCSIAGAHDPSSSWAVLQTRGDKLELKVEMSAESAWFFLGESTDRAPDIDHSLDRLRAQAAGVYRLSFAGQDLVAVATSVEQREEDGVVFRLAYPRPPGDAPVRFEATFMKRLSADHRSSLTLVDPTGNVFRAEVLNAKKSVVELPLPPIAPATDTPAK